MNEWWRWHRSHTLACFVRNFVCHVTYLPISPQGRPRFELSYRVYLQQPVEFLNCTYRQIITHQTPQSNFAAEYSVFKALNRARGYFRDNGNLINVVTINLHYTVHDDVIKWKHFPCNWPFVWGIHRSRWIPHTEASDAELWCFLWFASE